MLDKNPQNFKLFCRNELNMEMVRKIIDESYIANDEEKTILIAAESFNIPSQNALLKILEEPPNDVVFILLAKQKSLFLPTIRSRLPIINALTKEKLSPFVLDVKTLNLKKVYEFLKERQKEFKDPKLKSEIQSLFLDCVENGMTFNTKEMKMFEEAIIWEGQYARGHYIFLPLLMMILEKKRQKI